MPNWSSNAIVATSENESQLADFVNKFYHNQENSTGDRGGCFQALVPMPEALFGTTSPSNGPNWYDWHCDNWGTKWDVFYNDVTLHVDTPQKAHFSFDTAWAPPTTWLLTASKQFPDVKFELACSEQGNAFAGVQTIQNGELLDETDVHVEFDHPDDCDEDSDEYWVNATPCAEWQAHMDAYLVGMGG